MTACLSDRMLWALSEGDGTTMDGDHLAHCRLCADRARQMRDDIAVISHALRSPLPAAGAVAERTRRVALGWGLAGALAAIVLVVLVPVRLTQRRSPAVTDGVAALGALSTSVFGEDARPGTPTTDDLDVVATAFDSAGPCEWQPDGCPDEE
jgi:hypothetical protein